VKGVENRRPALPPPGSYGSEVQDENLPTINPRTASAALPIAPAVLEGGHHHGEDLIRARLPEAHLHRLRRALGTADMVTKEPVPSRPTSASELVRGSRGGRSSVESRWSPLCLPMAFSAKNSEGDSLAEMQRNFDGLCPTNRTRSEKPTQSRRAGDRFSAARKIYPIVQVRRPPILGKAPLSR